MLNNFYRVLGISLLIIIIVLIVYYNSTDIRYYWEFTNLNIDNTNIAYMYTLPYYKGKRIPIAAGLDTKMAGNKMAGTSSKNSTEIKPQRTSSGDIILSGEDLHKFSSIIVKDSFKILFNYGNLEGPKTGKRDNWLYPNIKCLQNFENNGCRDKIRKIKITFII